MHYNRFRVRVRVHAQFMLGHPLLPTRKWISMSKIKNVCSDDKKEMEREKESHIEEQLKSSISLVLAGHGRGALPALCCPRRHAEVQVVPRTEPYRQI